MITNTPYNSLIFCSSYHPDAAKHPKLEICYNTTTGIMAGSNLAETVLLFPNPASNQLNIFTGSNENTLITIFDLQAKYVLQNITSKTIDVSAFPNGVYIAEVKLGDVAFRKRWVKCNSIKMAGQQNLPFLFLEFK